MRTTWEAEEGEIDRGGDRMEWVTLAPPKPSAWRRTATQVGVLAVLAVVGGLGGAAIAAWSQGAGTADTAPDTVAQSSAPEMEEPRVVGAPPAVREASAAPAESTEPEIAADRAPDPARLETLFPEDGADFAAAPDGANVPDDTAMPEAEPAVALAETAETAEPAIRDVSAEAPAEIDRGETASILSSGEPVAVAETEEEAARLEALMVDEATGQAGSDEPLQQTAMVAPGTDMSPDGKPLTAARAAEYVNLRTGPDNDSEVIRVIPANAELLAEEDCVHWCAVVHEGTQGYVYKSFVTR